MSNQANLKRLALSLSEILAKDSEKNQKYIEFLQKHKLPNSGPTPKLLDSLNLNQRLELVEIIHPEKTEKT